MTDGNTSPPLSATFVSSGGSAASSRWWAAPPRSRRRSSLAASARADHGESGGAGASGLAPGAGFSMASEVAAQGRSSGKSERGVHLGGGDVLGFWMCRAEAAEKFPGAQVMLGASHVLSLVTHRSPSAPDVACGEPGFAGIPVQWSPPPDGTASPGGKIVSSVAPVLLPVAVTVVSNDTFFGPADVGCLLLFGGTFR